jgi:hypothetical protein
MTIKIKYPQTRERPFPSSLHTRLKDQGIKEMQMDEKSTLNALWIMFHDFFFNFFLESGCEVWVAHGPKRP